MAQSVQWKGSTALTRQANAPMWKFGDTITATDIYEGPIATVLAGAPRKGAIGTGEFAGLLVDEATVEPRKGQIGRLTIVYRGILADETQVPPNEPDLQMVEEDFDLARHPRYADLPRATIEAVEAWLALKGSDSAADYFWLIDDASEPDGSGTGSAARTIEYMEKRERGVEKFRIFVPRILEVSYYIEEPTCDPGGYPEEPVASVTAPLGWDWLRLGDQLSWTGTYWKLTQAWQGAPDWDPQIYPVEPFIP